MSHDRRTNHGNAMHGIVTLIALVTVLMGGCEGHSAVKETSKFADTVVRGGR